MELKSGTNEEQRKVQELRSKNDCLSGGSPCRIEAERTGTNSEYDEWLLSHSGDSGNTADGFDGDYFVLRFRSRDEQPIQQF